MKRAYVFTIAPHAGGFIIESPNGGGTVLARKPRGPAVLDPVGPRVFATQSAASEYMQRKGMTPAAPALPGLDIPALRKAQTALLDDIQQAIARAPDKPDEHRAFRMGPARYVVVNSRDRLASFADAIARSPGFRKSRPREIGRERERGRAMRATEPDRAITALSDGVLQTRLLNCKEQVMDRMRGALAGRYSYSPEARVADGEQIDAMQRELVRRGLLDATDHDKVNAVPVHEDVKPLPTVAIAALATRARRHTPALRAVPKAKPAVAPAPALHADAVEFVEAIETADGRIVMVAFDDDLVILGLFEGFEHRLHSAQDVRVALAAPAAGAMREWPASAAMPQRIYDRLTARPVDYCVIGRWSRDEGLDLRELRFSRLLGRGPRAILGPALAA